MAQYNYGGPWAEHPHIVPILVYEITVEHLARDAPVHWWNRWQGIEKTEGGWIDRQFQEDEHNQLLGLMRSRIANISPNLRIDELTDPRLQAADFGGVHFQGGQYFNGFYFQPDQNGIGVDFRNARFVKGTDIRGAYFAGQALFSNSHFGERVDFSDCQFQSLAAFRNSEFLKEMVFRGCKFFSSFDIQNSQITSARMEGATFEKFAYFDDCKFSESSEFDDVRFLNKSSFENCAFSSTASFRGSDFSDVSFNNANFSSTTSFSEVVFEMAPRFHGATLFEETSWIDVVWPDPPESESKESLDFTRRHWNRLKTEMSRLQLHEDEQMFFALELDVVAAMSPRSKRWVINSYKGLSGYGRSIGRPALWLLVSALLGLLINFSTFVGYTQKFNFAEWEIVSKFTLANMFGAGSLILDLRKRDKWITELKGLEAHISDWPWWVETYAIFQGVFTLILIFLVGLALRNRFRIK